MAKSQRDTPYRHRAWGHIRRHVLNRDNHRCQIHGPNCTGQATEVDHIIPWSAGGAWFDPANLRAACKPCNAGRASRTKADTGWRTSNTHITLVIGPPGAGKTTWVETHRTPGDITIDLDRIAEAVGSDRAHGHDPGVTSAARVARGAILRGLQRGGLPEVGRAWIVSANPDAEQFIPHHDVVTIDPGRDEVHRRAAEAGRPALWVELIDTWYARRATPLDSASSRDW